MQFPPRVQLTLLTVAALAVPHVASSALAAEEPATRTPSASGARAETTAPSAGDSGSHGDDPSSSGSPAEDSSERPSPQRESQRIYIDPTTGRATLPLPSERSDAAIEPGVLFTTSHVGLRAVELPNGLTYVDFRNRFLDASRATIDEEGNLVIRHGLPEPKPPQPAPALPQAEKGPSSPEKAPKGEDR